MIKGTIRRRLLLYFTAALILYSLVAGAVFIPLLRSQAMSDYKNYMEAQAASIASSIAGFMEGVSVPGGKNGDGTGGYGAYLRFVDDISMADVWIIDQNMNLVQENNQTEPLDYGGLPEDAGTLIRQAFLGETAFSDSFGSVFEAPTLTLGMPIRSGDRILGVVLLHAPVAGIQDTTWTSLRLLGISTLVGLVLSVLLAAYLASSFTRPLERIKGTAMGLSEGMLETRTELPPEGEIGALGAALDDLGGKLQAASEQSRALEALRRDFVANVSHELNTPVTVLRGSLEALQDGVISDPEQIKETHKDLLQETIALQRLVGDLMELTRLQNTGFSILQETLDLQEALSDAIRSAKPLAIAKNISLELQQDGALHLFEGDYGRLKQMFLTVLDNAVKYSPDGSIVTVRLQGQSVVIADQGPGISEEDLPHLFDRFYRARSGQAKPGTGLGLAIAKEIAGRHGILLEAGNGSPHGTEFVFTFPKQQ